MMASVFAWDLDLFKLDKLSGGRPLLHVGLAVCYGFRLHEKFKIAPSKLVHFLTGMESGYNSLGFPFHNSLHGT